MSSVAIKVTSRDSYGVSNHRQLYHLFSREFKSTSRITLTHRVTSLCEGNPSVTGEFSSQRAGKAENISILWRQYAIKLCELKPEVISRRWHPWMDAWTQQHLINRVMDYVWRLWILLDPHLLYWHRLYRKTENYCILSPFTILPYCRPNYS